MVSFSPAGGDFTQSISVTMTVKNATEAWYKVGDGAETAINGESATISIGSDIAEGESVTIYWSATNSSETRTGKVTYNKVPEASTKPMTIYYDNSITAWSKVLVHYWGGETSSSWPGAEMTLVEGNIYSYTVPAGTSGLVFNNGNGEQTNDITKVEANHLYKGTGNKGFEDCGIFGGSGIIMNTDNDAPALFYNLQGIEVKNPVRGNIYIVRKGNEVRRVMVR